MLVAISIAALWFLAGLLLIIFSGERFVKSAIRIAEIFHIPALYIGTFLVGFSTSVPEIIVTYIASRTGSVDLAIGNVLGSYICNIGFVIGITAIIKPLHISTETLSRAIPLMAMAIFITALLLLIDGQFTHLDGMLLLTLFVAYLVMSYLHISRNPDRFTRKQPKRKTPAVHPLRTCLVFALSLIVLLIGSEIMVNAARDLALLFHVSELVIGITIVAIGTSLPELTACIIAVLNDEDDIAIGNIVGSNIFCLLCVLSIPLIMAPPHAISPEKLWIPMAMMLLVTVALWLFSAKFDKTCQISRLEGMFLVFISSLYLIFTMTS